MQRLCAEALILHKYSAMSSSPNQNHGDRTASQSQSSPHPRESSVQTPAPNFKEHEVAEDERPLLLEWLNTGLRSGRSRRLEAEFPTALSSDGESPATDQHVLLKDANGRFVSHALIHTLQVTALDKTISLGMIGMVYTDPAYREMGAASKTLAAATARLKNQGTSLAILWSDLDGFYQRNGFYRAGVENFYLLNPTLCRSARSETAGDLTVRDALPNDWPDLETFYANKPSRALRTPGSLRRLASAPECKTVVATLNGSAVAYASIGRGDDLGGVVHEWGGSEEGLAECLHQLSQTHGELTLLEGPVHERATRLLRMKGARPHPGTFGLMRILDADTLWKDLCTDDETLNTMRLEADLDHANTFLFKTKEREFVLSHQSALSLLFGPGLPRTLSLGLAQAEREAIGRRLPWPLFIWGFDSI